MILFIKNILTSIKYLFWEDNSLENKISNLGTKYRENRDISIYTENVTGEWIIILNENTITYPFVYSNKGYNQLIKKLAEIEEESNEK